MFGGVVRQPSAVRRVTDFNFGDGAVGSLAAGALSAVNGELDYDAREWRIYRTPPARPTGSATSARLSSTATATARHSCSPMPGSAIRASAWASIRACRRASASIAGPRSAPGCGMRRAGAPPRLTAGRGSCARQPSWPARPSRGRSSRSWRARNGSCSTRASRAADPAPVQHGDRDRGQALLLKRNGQAPARPRRTLHRRACGSRATAHARRRHGRGRQPGGDGGAGAGRPAGRGGFRRPIAGVQGEAGAQLPLTVERASARREWLRPTISSVLGLRGGRPA